MKTSVFHFILFLFFLRIFMFVFVCSDVKCLLLVVASRKWRVEWTKVRGGFPRLLDETNEFRCCVLHPINGTTSWIAAWNLASLLSNSIKLCTFFFFQFSFCLDICLVFGCKENHQNSAVNHCVSDESIWKTFQFFVCCYNEHCDHIECDTRKLRRRGSRGKLNNEKPAVCSLVNSEQWAWKRPRNGKRTNGEEGKKKSQEHHRALY